MVGLRVMEEKMKRVSVKLKFGAIGKRYIQVLEKGKFDLDG